MTTTTEQARYTAVWIRPAGSLNQQVEIYSGDDENAAIAAAAEYDAPAAGEVKILHQTAAGHLIGTRTVEHSDAGTEIIDRFLDHTDAEAGAATTAELHHQADEVEASIDAGPVAESDDGLFDPADYQTEELALPMVDGISVAKIGVNIQGGTIWLERGDPRHVALIRDLRVGNPIRLLVDARVGVPRPGFSTNRGGELDVVSLRRDFKIVGVAVAASQPEPIQAGE